MKKTKKPLFKRVSFWIILLLLIGAIRSCGSSDSSQDTTETEAQTEAELEIETTLEETEAVELSEKDQIKKILSDRITDQYSNTDIDDITINDDAGTEEDGDYIALVRLTWNVKNSGKTSKEMLTMYSNDLAATLAKENESVNEIAIFWEVPYLNDNAKCQFERKNDGFYPGDTIFGKAFN